MHSTTKRGSKAMKKNKLPTNPNKRPCIAKHITFTVHGEHWIRISK